MTHCGNYHPHLGQHFIDHLLVGACRTMTLFRTSTATDTPIHVNRVPRSDLLYARLTTKVLLHTARQRLDPRSTSSGSGSTAKSRRARDRQCRGKVGGRSWRDVALKPRD